MTVNQQTIELAAAFRLAARMDLHEGIDNHFSLALVDSSQRFLVNPYGLHWSEIKANDIAIADAVTGVIEGNKYPEVTALQIHSAIHRMYPSARCVLHTHMPYATALSLLADGRLQMVEQNAMRFHERISYVQEYRGLAEDAAEAERLARGMNGRPIAFWRGHGVVVTAPTVHQAFDDLYFLERACRLQVFARKIGTGFVSVPTEVVSRTASQMAASDESARLHFEALMRILDREEPSFRD